MFAHRLGAKMFGRSGHCFSIKRLRQWYDGAQYMAELGTVTGPRTLAPLTVQRER
jgi:hypothetical protein